MLDLLLRHGASVDARSVEGATPLMNAVQQGNEAKVALLISRGADINAQDARGFTSLHRAAEMGRLEIVHQLLAHGANPHIETLGYTAISLAELSEEHEIVALLRALA
jgi:ankyrin repeat protein